MRKTLFALVCAATLGAATFTGTITDDMCRTSGHAPMKMGADEKCVMECIKGMNGKFMLYDGHDAFGLTGQKVPRELAARKVTILGTLDAKSKTIRVEKIEPAQ